MSSISDMEWKVREQERINRELRTELNEMEAGIDSVRQKWEEIANQILSTLTEGNSRLEQSQQLTQETERMEQRLEQVYERFKHMENSNKKIRECNNRIYYDFSDYTRVRKIVDGLLNNLEVGFVRDSTVLRSIESAQLKQPDYWLTCAMIALMAWRNDDRPWAEAALQRACMLDQKNTAIFFFSVYLRMGRPAAALKWFECYTQCERTGSDNQNILFMFSILTQNADGLADDRLYQSISDFVRQLIDERLSAENYSEDEKTAKIRTAYYQMLVSEPFAYPLLTKHCGDSSTMNKVLLYAKNNINILDFIRTVVNVTSHEKQNSINGFIDEVIRRANSTEISVRNEIHYHETVIRLLGDIELAKREHDEWLAHNVSELDIIGELISWLYDSEEADVTPEERKRFFLLTKDLNRTAAEIYAADYRSKRTDIHPVQIGDYSSEADLRTPGSENQKIEAFYHEREQAELSQQKIWQSVAGFSVSGLCIVLAFVLSPVMLVLAAACSIFGGVKLLMTKRAKVEITRKCLIDIDSAQKQFAQIQDEYARYLLKYEEYDAVTEEIAAEYDKL